MIQASLNLKIHHNMYQPTERELQILDMLRSGTPDKIMAAELNVSFWNLNRLIKKMIKKYNCFNRPHLISTVLELGVIELQKKDVA